jgi:hypothetical protein
MKRRPEVEHIFYLKRSSMEIVAAVSITSGREDSPNLRCASVAHW